MNFKFLLIFLIISACALSPGFKKEPSSKNPKKMGLQQNGVSLMFYNLNKINASSLPRIKDIKKNIQPETPKWLLSGPYVDRLVYQNIL